MTETERMAQEINGFFKAIGEEQEQLEIPSAGECKSELEFLRKIKKQYKARLLQKMPQYQGLRPEAIPDMFLMALNKRESELLAQE